MNIPFVPFYFEGNAAWGLVRCLEDWQRITGLYAAACPKMLPGELLEEAQALSETDDVESGRRVAPPWYQPTFGLRREYCSPLTLKEWAMKKDMYPFLT